MKRFLSLTLALICLSWICVPFVSAEETDTEIGQETNTNEKDMLSEFSCRYDRSERKIVVAGIVRHEVLISHRQYFLDVYRILPGEDYESIVFSSNKKPLVSTEISVRFEFSLDAESILERFSHYAVVLRSPEGERILAAKPQRAEVEGGYEYVSDDFSSFKGLLTSETSLGGNLGIGTAIVPVYLERFLNTSSQGYIYPFSEGIMYFNKDYIQALDATIRTYSSTGSRVYLQFLLSANESDLALASGKNIGARYDMPNAFSEDALLKICAITEFLAERYTDHQTGEFCGIIVGHSIDDPMMNYCGSLSLDQYSKLYSLYLTAVSCSLRTHQPSVDVIIPFSSENSYAEEALGGTSYPSGQLLEAILKIQDDGSSVPFRCGTMICMESDRESQTKLTAESIDTYSAYLDTLRSKYESAPMHYMVRWDVPELMAETALCANYSYLYYKLIGDQRVSSFVVSFSRCEEKGLYRLGELKQIVRYIDTEDSLTVTTPLLSYFGLDSWDRVIEGATARNYAVRREISGDWSSHTRQENYAGNFTYMDFSDGDMDQWAPASSCLGLKIDYGRDGVRILKGTVRRSETEYFGEFLCLYEFPERIVHTPYLRFRMELTDSSGAADQGYHVMVTLGNDQSRIVTQYVAKKDVLENIMVDVSDFPEDQMITYIKISVRPLVDSANGSDEISVQLYDIVGYSDRYTSEELSDMIEEDRLNIRNMTKDSDADDGEQMWWILGMVTLGISIIIGVFACFRNEEDGTEK